jgi:hypothetical protein
MLGLSAIAGLILAALVIGPFNASVPGGPLNAFGYSVSSRSLLSSATTNRALNVDPGPLAREEPAIDL